MKHSSSHIILFFCLMLCSLGPCAAQRISSTDTTTTHKMRGTFYSDRFVGRKTSSGEVFRQDRYTAAHHSLKFGTLLLVTNPKNGKQVMVRINDRCPKDRIIDMTRSAARAIGINSASVEVQVLPPRFLVLWEKQKHLLDILAQGQLMEYAKTYFSNLDIQDQNLFDIELAKGSAANLRKSIDKLPLPYQEMVDTRQHGNATNCTLVLSLSLPYEEAIKILNSLLLKFPNAKLIKSK